MSLLLPLVVALKVDNIVDVQPWLDLLGDLTGYDIVLILTEGLVLLGLKRFFLKVLKFELAQNLLLIEARLILDRADLVR